MFPVAIVHWSGINQILRLFYYIKPTQRTCLQLSHFWGEKIETVDLSGSHWTGEDAGAGREEPQQHRGQPLAETRDWGVRLQPREHCEYHLTELYTLCNIEVTSCNQLATIIEPIASFYQLFAHLILVTFEKYDQFSSQLLICGKLPERDSWDQARDWDRHSWSTGSQNDTNRIDEYLCFDSSVYVM